MAINTAPQKRVELRKTLTLVQVVMMGLAYLQPMTILIPLVSLAVSPMATLLHLMLLL